MNKSRFWELGFSPNYTIAITKVSLSSYSSVSTALLYLGEDSVLAFQIQKSPKVAMSSQKNNLKYVGCFWHLLTHRHSSPGGCIATLSSPPSKGKLLSSWGAWRKSWHGKGRLDLWITKQEEVIVRPVKYIRKVLRKVRRYSMYIICTCQGL